MKIAVLTTDNREPDRAYSELVPRFGTGMDSMISGVARIPELQMHVVSCTQRPMRSPDKLAENIWFHSLHVPKIGWMRTSYQGCIRAIRRKMREIKPDVVQGIGTEREAGISAVFSGFPNVITIQGNMAELARLSHARFGSFHWLAGKLEDFTLPRSDGVISNSIYTEHLVKPRAKKSWLIYPGLRSVFLQPPTHTGPRDCALVIAGVISERKRQLEMLDLAAELHRRGLKFELRFVGYAYDRQQPYVKAFLERIESVRSVGYARYLGSPSHEEMVRCFDAASGMIHFPTEEAFGSVVAEGLARDLKFFGTRTGGVIEITKDVPGAELFEKEDWAGLTSAVAKWIEAGAPPAVGAADLMAQRYEPEVFARQHLRVYEETVRSRQRKGNSS